jgi:transposase
MHQLTHVGLDVHKDAIAVAVLQPGTTEVDERVIPNTPEAVRRIMGPFTDPSGVRVCYDAGPSGYDTHRTNTALGYPWDVIAPSLIPRRSGAHVKTDRSMRATSRDCTARASLPACACREALRRRCAT